MNNSFKENAELVAKLIVKVVMKIYLFILLIKFIVLGVILIIGSIFLWFAFQNAEKYTDQYTYFSGSDNSYTCGTRRGIRLPFLREARLKMKTSEFHNQDRFKNKHANGLCCKLNEQTETV